MNAVKLFANANAPRLGAYILIIVIFNGYNALIIIIHDFFTFQSGNIQDFRTANSTFGELDYSIFAAKYRYCVSKNFVTNNNLPNNMKNELLIYTLEVLTGFFAIMNPFANLPIFLGLVKGKSQKTARQIAWKSTSMAFIIITLFVIFGKMIFDIFHLTIPAFKITGGLLIFHVGYEMLQSKAPSSHSQKSMPEDFGVAISPLGIPILAGPGTIITAMNTLQVWIICISSSSYSLLV